MHAWRATSARVSQQQWDVPAHAWAECMHLATAFAVHYQAAGCLISSPSSICQLLLQGITVVADTSNTDFFAGGPLLKEWAGAVIQSLWLLGITHAMHNSYGTRMSLTSNTAVSSQAAGCRASQWWQTRAIQTSLRGK